LGFSGKPPPRPRFQNNLSKCKNDSSSSALRRQLLSQKGKSEPAQHRPAEERKKEDPHWPSDSGNQKPDLPRHRKPAGARRKIQIDRFQQWSEGEQIAHDNETAEHDDRFPLRRIASAPDDCVSREENRDQSLKC
jgi:hypothetical protein